MHVVREAATYLLCELALDDTAVAALGCRERSEARVAAREETVRARLSALVRDAAPRLAEACTRLGKLDSFLARVRFAQRTQVEPQIGAAGTALEFEAARFLPLAARLAQSGRAYEPISLALERRRRRHRPEHGRQDGRAADVRFRRGVRRAGGSRPRARREASARFDAIAWIGIGRGGEETALLSSFGSELVEVARAPRTPLRRPRSC